jgi:type IV pilus assembly protein PilB
MLLETVMQNTEQTLNGFAYHLVANKYLNENEVRVASQEATQKKIPLIYFLGKNNYICCRKLAEATAHYFDLPLYDLSHYDPNSLLTDIFNLELIQKHLALPLFHENQQLFLAVADPLTANLNEINFLTGFSASLVIVAVDQLSKIIAELCSKQLKAGFEIADKDLESVVTTSDVEPSDNNMSQTEPAKAPLVRYLNKILLDAINKRASDIHFEPFSNHLRIRYRIDGILYQSHQQPIKLANYIITRLKVMANLDISERRLPQDGRFKINLLQNQAVNFRINTCPTVYGEKAVLRILQASNELLDMNTLGMNTTQKHHFMNAIQHSQGMILVTGPTGSGKTVTLYTALQRLNTSEVNICSVEDPIEIHLAGINQVQTHSKIGLTFATALRAFLRQDPDIIMVGEIRDLETAEIAVKAAQTGHLVLSTLHTNSAAEALTRLANMGIAGFNIASSIILIVAQRLVRILCNHCKIKAKIPEKILVAQGFQQQELSELKIYCSGCCEHCNNGYQGRIGIYEIIPISKDMTKLIVENAGSLQLAEQARNENIIHLRRAGLEKVKEGITSLEEVNRVFAVDKST